MSDVQIDVRRMFVESFTALNEKITGFPLYYSQRELPCDFSQNIKIQSSGLFHASMYISMEKSFEDAVWKGMAKKEELSAELKKLYLGEFINVLCGHALTHINDVLGSSSRLTVPAVGQSEWHERSEFLKEYILYFHAECGVMKVEIACEC